MQHLAGRLQSCSNMGKMSTDEDSDPEIIEVLEDSKTDIREDQEEAKQDEEEDEESGAPRLRQIKRKYVDQDETEEESDSDDQEFRPSIKLTKRAPSSPSEPRKKAEEDGDAQRTLCCRQLVSNVELTTSADPEAPDAPLSEEQALKHERLVVVGSEEMAYLLLTDYSFYDMNRHLVPLDAGLVEAGKRIFFKGR